ncbi:MAG: hypothetical protein ACREPM_04350 [Gemmatimonadaceae bacterium]
MEHIAEIATLRRTMEAAGDTRSVDDLDAMRRATVAVVDILQASGWPVEAVIIQVKRTANEAGLTSMRAIATGADRLVSDCVRWAIDHYYRLA